MADALPRVLIVDDNKQITDLIAELTQPFEDEFKTLVTNKPEEVMQLLAVDSNIKVIVTDFKMPNLNGLDLIINVKEKYPQIQFIMMTGYGTPSLKKKLADKGVLRYLEKPLSLRELIQIIQDTLQVTPEGFEGFVPALQLPDVIQLIAVSRGDGELVIESKDSKGNIYFRDGNIIHAVCGDLNGLEAFYQIARSESGQFIVKDLPPSIPQTIVESWQALLLESARMEDEEKAEADGESPTTDEDSEISDASEIESIFNEAAQNSDMEESVTKTGTVVEASEIENSDDVKEHKYDLDIDFEDVSPEGQTQQEITTMGDNDAASESDTIDSSGDPEEIQFDSSVDGSDLPPDQVSGISFVDIEDSLESCVDHLMTIYPGGKDKVPIKAIPVKDTIEVIRQFITFHIHTATTMVVRSESGPFDFTEKKVAEAAVKLIEALLDSWEVSEDEFRQILFEAVRFQLAKVLDPPAAISELLHEYSEGLGRRIVTVLTSMIRQNVAPIHMDNTLDEFNSRTSELLELKDIENVLRNSYSMVEFSTISDEVRNSLTGILIMLQHCNITEKNSFQQEIITAIFDSRNFSDFNTHLTSKFSSSTDPINIDMLASEVESYLQQTK